jgi:hypothetical protein
MAVLEPVESYSVAVTRNEVVPYRESITVTAESGEVAFLAFVQQPPTDWLTINGPIARVYLERSQFDRIHHLLQTERPLFLTTMSGIFGKAFNLSSSPELPGEGPADDDALADLAAALRAAATG